MLLMLLLKGYVLKKSIITYNVVQYYLRMQINWRCLNHWSSIKGKYIPASQRPDGTWRKARRVKEGYVPQEEVPLYESKGKQHMSKVKPDLPVGMCPIIAQQAKQKREKREKQQAAKTAGLIQLPDIRNHIPIPVINPEVRATSNQSTNASVPSKKSNKNKNNKIDNTKSVTETISNLTLSTEDDLTKKLKKLRKKIREIEMIEEKLNSGQLKNPEQDQLDKVSRKPQILKELAELEKFEVKE